MGDDKHGFKKWARGSVVVVSQMQTGSHVLLNVR